MASAAIVFLLLFLLSAAVTAQPEPTNLITLGSSLSPITPPTSWFSPSRLFAFGFYPQGNGFAVGIWLAGKPENTVVWTANRDDPPVSAGAKLEFTKDGELLLRTVYGKEKPIVDLLGPAVSASMLDSGNFVIYDNASQVIWESFHFPTDTILGGQNLSSGQKLLASVSGSDHSSGKYHLEMQSDGNLVAYPVNSSNTPETAYWSTQTFGYIHLSLNRWGLLQLWQSSLTIRTIAKSSYSGKKGTIIHRATIDANGFFRLYSHRFAADNVSVLLAWSALQDQCEVKGFCGLNSYCSNAGTKADCICFPGFVFVDSNETSQGCYKNFSVMENCGEREPEMFHQVTPIDHMELWGLPYSVGLMDEKTCSKSCLEDCYCEAALYFNVTCQKYKLPLRYGLINQNESVRAFIKVSLGDSPITNHPPPFPKSLVALDSKKTLIQVLALSLGSIAFLCSLIAILTFFVYRSQAHRYRKLSRSVNLTGEFTLRLFSYKELEKATDGFKEELCRGSFGAVYRGTLSESKRIVAVKKLEGVVEESERDFQAEITAIGRTHHRNLVQLIGFCIEGSRKLLVYEYMSNGSLADLLFKVGRHPLWKERVRIALEVARGILYLHEECEASVIHCDIKPQNILMDDSWTVKIADFGLAKLLMPNQSRIMTSVRGTRGYLAPEWQKNDLISVKADIYSFGVLLLEIVCCRSNMEVNVPTADEVLLSTWVHNCFVAGQLEKLVGNEEVDMRALERMVKVGLLCIQDDQNLRPSIKNVILMLEGTMDIPLAPSPSPSFVIS